MPTQNQIDRALILIYRSNNSQDYINFSRNWGWLDKLPMAGLDELASMLEGVKEEVKAEMDRRKRVGMTTYPAEHYKGEDSVN